MSVPHRKVFGIGLHKTGTTTLAECLRLLGYDVCPEADGYATRVAVASGDYSKAITLVVHYNAFVDSPWNYDRFYETLAVTVPQSCFILTTRDVDQWYLSMRRWVVEGNGSASGIDATATIGTELHRQMERAAKDGYIEWHDRARSFFAQKQYKDRLLEVSWEDGDGWEEVCGFLGRPVPRYELPWMLRYDHAQKAYTNFTPVA